MSYRIRTSKRRLLLREWGTGLQTVVACCFLAVNVAVCETESDNSRDSDLAVGDFVVVTTSDAELRVGKSFLAEIARGQVLPVNKVQGDWIWTRYTIKQEAADGWIHRRHVVLLEPGSQYSDSPKLTHAMSAASLGWNGMCLRTSGQLLIVNEWGDEPKGLYLVTSDSERKPIPLSTGELFTDPEHAIELPEGIYVTNNRGHGKILFVPTEGGPPTVFVEEGITNPYEIHVAPPGFQGADVKPGDLVLFDNGFGQRPMWGVWSVDRQTGEARRFARGLEVPQAPLSGGFGPDGTLYALLNNFRRRSGVTIVTISPEGEMEYVLENFVPQDADFQVSGSSSHLVVNPMTGEVYFDIYGEIFAFTTGETPRRILSGGYRIQLSSPTGTKLFLQRGDDLWTLEDSIPDR